MPAKLKDMRGEKRNRTVKEIADYLGAEHLPLVWQAALVQSHLDELSESETPSVEASMALVDLVPVPEFDAMKPTLGALQGSPAQKAKIFTRVALTDPLLPWVARGAACVDKVKAWCTGLKGKVEEMLPDIECDIMQAAGKEVLEMIGCLDTILDISSYSEESVAMVSSVMEAKHGPKFLLRGAILQNPFYKEAEKQCRSCHVAARSLAPEIQRHIEVLAGAVSVEDIKAILQLLPSWRDSLRAGFTLEVEQKLLDAVESLLTKYEKEGAKDKITALAEVTRQAANLPLSPPLVAAKVTNQRHQELAKRCESLKRSMARGQRMTDMTGVMGGFVKFCKGSSDSVSELVKFADIHSHFEEAFVNNMDEPTPDVLESAKAITPLLTNSSASLLCQSVQAEEHEIDVATMLSAAIAFIGALEILSKAEVVKVAPDVLASLEVLREHHKLVEAVLAIGSGSVGQGVVNAEFLKQSSQLMSGLEVAKRIGKKMERHAVQVWDSLKAVRDTAANLITNLQAGVQQHVHATLEEVCKKVEERVGGLPGGGSWKAGISSDKAQWKEVMKASAGMISGDTVKQLMRDFKLLQKDFRD